MIHAFVISTRNILIPERATHPRATRLLLAALLLWIALPVTAATVDIDDSEKGKSPGVQWLGPDGHPLPFASEDELLGFLREAPVVKKKVLSSGTTKPLKVTLAKDGVKLNAIFRYVDVEQPAPAGEPKINRNVFRDSYLFELAAYEMSRLLAVDRVPPVVLRKIDGKPGSLQLWVENASTEASRIKKEQPPQHPGLWHLQKQALKVFDNLIYNFDRNPGNMLFDREGTLWYIDHTRSFKRLPALIDGESLRICDREFYERLQNLDADEIRDSLRPYLEPMEVNALLKRRDQMLRRFERLIDEEGEDSVLFDLDDRLQRPRTAQSQEKSAAVSGAWHRSDSLLEARPGLLA